MTDSDVRLTALELNHGVLKETIVEQKKLNERILEKLEKIDDKLEKKIQTLEQFAAKQAVLNRVVVAALAAAGLGGGLFKFFV